MSSKVRVRIAPSPTGSPHIGTAWQALFDYVFAKKNNGTFILRLEDTDRARLVPESVDQIKETLSWLGFEYDEGPDKEGSFGPYIQSERLEIYKKYAQELLEKKLAYEDDGAIRFRTIKEGETSWNDLIGEREISFGNKTQEDFVILKTDGYPTYNFANVVDDHLMEITHVIRGNEFISSTPKHIMLYSAFGWQPPQFAHLPVLVGEDRQKLSKRNGAKGALEFRDEGFLKEAVINFLALLGWTHPQGLEIFTLSDMIKVFDFKDFNQSSAFFDIKKLEWINGEYIRKSRISTLKSQIIELSPHLSNLDHLDKFIELAQTRMKKLNEFYDLVKPFAEEGEKELSNDEKKVSQGLFTKLNDIEMWNKEEILKTIKEVLELNKCNMKTIYKILTGTTSGLPLGDVFEIIGKEKTLSLLPQ